MTTQLTRIYTTIKHHFQFIIKNISLSCKYKFPKTKLNNYSDHYFHFDGKCFAFLLLKNLLSGLCWEVVSVIKVLLQVFPFYWVSASWIQSQVSSPWVLSPDFRLDPWQGTMGAALSHHQALCSSWVYFLPIFIMLKCSKVLNISVGKSNRI